jgi:ABC-type polysaccharide/polyol phosphate export permease
MAMKEMISSIEIQYRVVKALFLREMISHFGRNNIGFLWMFVEPMMFSLGITILWSFMNHAHGSIPVAGFALTGYSALVAWRNCVSRTSLAVKSNMGLLYHRNITVFDLALTRVLFEFTAVSCSFLFLALLFIGLDLIPPPNNLLQVLTAWLLLGWFYGSSGFIALYLDYSSAIFGKIWHVIIYLTLPFTGAVILTSWLPKPAQDILLLSPMVHGVEFLREGFFGEHIHAIYSVTYLLQFNIIWTLIALCLVSKVKRNLTNDH